MAKKKVSEKRVTSTKLTIEGALNIDKLTGLILEVEDEGERDFTDILKKYNGSYGTLTWTEKIEEDIEE